MEAELQKARKEGQLPSSEKLEPFRSLLNTLHALLWLQRLCALQYLELKVTLSGSCLLHISSARVVFRCLHLGLYVDTYESLG